MKKKTKRILIITAVSVAVIAAVAGTVLGIMFCGGGHQHFMRTVRARAATCTEDGNSAYYHCEDCGKYFADAEAAQELDYETEVMIPANPEKHVEATNGRNNTAITCRDCGKLFRYQFAVNDDRVTRSRAIDGKTQAIGAKWNTETSFSFDFVAEKAGTATLYVTMSKNTAELAGEKTFEQVGQGKAPYAEFAR